MSFHVCKCEHKGRDEWHIRYPGMTEREVQSLADEINSGDGGMRHHLRLAVEHIAALTGALEDLASLGATVAICGTKYDDAAARKVLGPNVQAQGPSPRPELRDEPTLPGEVPCSDRLERW